MIHTIAKAPPLDVVIQDLDQVSLDEEEEAVQDMIRRTLESLADDDKVKNVNDFDDDDIDDDAGYETEDSWDVTRRRLGVDAVIVRRRRPVVNRDKALAAVPAVPWPMGNQDNTTVDCDTVDPDCTDDDDDEVAAVTAASTRQRTAQYFRSKVSHLSEHYTGEKYSSKRPATYGMMSSSVKQSSMSSLPALPQRPFEVSPDSVLSFSLASTARNKR
jgi:hypothetical protein